jgi:hypothetical protein
MARGRGREHFIFNQTGIAVTLRLQRAPPEAPKAPGTPRMILLASGALVPSHRPPTEAEKAERAEREQIEGQKSIEAFLAKAALLKT